jgi:hypothetical protein
MQLPPTPLFIEPLPGPPAVYDTPPVVVRRRRMRALLARVRREPAERRRLHNDEPALSPARR